MEFALILVSAFAAGLLVGHIYLIFRRPRPTPVDVPAKVIGLSTRLIVANPGGRGSTLWAVDQMNFGWDRANGDYLILKCFPAIEERPSHRTSGPYGAPLHDYPQDLR